MVDVALTRNDNLVIQRGVPLSTDKKVKTATNVKPGRLVMRDTTDAQIKVGTVGGKVTGWAGYERTPTRYQPATIDTAYSANDIVTIHFGGGFALRAYLKNGENVIEGTLLVAAANGEVAEATAATTAAGTTAVTSTAASITIPGSLPTEGLPVARALESVDASGSALPIMVQSLI